MKINNKGFAISSIMYMILVLAIILIILILSILSSRTMILSKLSNEAILDISNTVTTPPIKKVILVDYIKGLYSQTQTVTSSSTINSYTALNLKNITYSLDTTHQLMYDRLGGTTASLTDGNLRYYGKNPNNYIDIGDRDANGNIIFWRIMGVFKNITVNDNGTTKQEDLVKIMREDYLTAGSVSGFSWDLVTANDGDEFCGDSYSPGYCYNNDWTDSTLKTMLNSDTGYYGSGSSYNFYNFSENSLSITKTTLNFSSTGLSSTARNRVANVKWIIGGMVSSTKDGKTIINYQFSIDDFYQFERNKEYRSEKNVIDSLYKEWNGNIGLMYPSDYGYASDLSKCSSVLRNYQYDEECKGTNWIYINETQWTITPFSGTSGYTFDNGSLGGIFSSNARIDFRVRPVMYLKSDIEILNIQKTKDGINYYEVV